MKHIHIANQAKIENISIIQNSQLHHIVTQAINLLIEKTYSFFNFAQDAPKEFSILKIGESRKYLICSSKIDMIVENVMLQRVMLSRGFVHRSRRSSTQAIWCAHEISQHDGHHIFLRFFFNHLLIHRLSKPISIFFRFHYCRLCSPNNQFHCRFHSL